MYMEKVEQRAQPLLEDAEVVITDHPIQALDDWIEMNEKYLLGRYNTYELTRE